MKVKRSTGIKRIVITCTIVFPIVFFSLAFVADEVPYNSRLAGNLRLLGLIFIPLPVVVYKFGYWIADGFQRDKE